jgi:drug/metabolite transporter (DMT)-like permease
MKSNNDPTSASTTSIVFYLLFTVLAFSSVEIIANPIRELVTPMQLTFWRFTIGVMFLLPFLIYRRRHQLKELTFADLTKLFFLGALNIIFSMGAHAVCMKYAKASTAAILIAANPIATNFFSWAILKENMGMKRVSALMLGFSGIVLMALKPDPASDTPLGLAAGIAGLIGFGLYTVLSKKLVQKHGSLMVMVISSSTALIAYIPLLHFSGNGILPVSSAWPALLALGIFGSGLGYITFFKALEFLPAGKASYLFFFKPPVAIILAWLVLGETPVSAAIIGTGLIMCGILIENLRKTGTNSGQKQRTG